MMKINKVIALALLLSFAPMTIVSNSFAQDEAFQDMKVQLAEVPTELIIPVLLIGIPLGLTMHFAPSLVGWNACAERTKLENKIFDFKATLNHEQLQIFNKAYQSYDTWGSSKAPFAVQAAAFLVPMPSTIKAAMWSAAAGSAVAAQYLQYYNEEQFKKAVAAVKNMDEDINN